MKFLKRLFSKPEPTYNIVDQYIKEYTAEPVYPASAYWKVYAEEIHVIVSSALGEGGVDFYNPEEHKPKG
jgi:hypothetical protein